MKKVVLFLVGVIFAINLFAQDKKEYIDNQTFNSFVSQTQTVLNNLEITIDSLADVNANNKSTTDSLSAVNSSLKNMLKEYGKEIEDIKGGINKTSEQKWDIVRKNIINVQKTTEKLHIGLKSMRTVTSMQNYVDIVNEMSAINNTRLGFDFDSIIIKQARKLSFKKKTKINIIPVLQNVINSPLIPTIPYVSEALVLGNSVLNIISSIQLNEKEIKLDEFNEFETEIMKYLAYYSAIEKANSLIGNRNTLIKEDIIFIQSKLIDYVCFNLKLLNITYPQKTNHRENSDYLDLLINNYFSSDKIIEYLNIKDQQYEQDITLFSNETKLKEINNNIDVIISLTNEFLIKTESYISTQEEYNKLILDAVKIADEKGILDNDKILLEKEINKAHSELLKNLKNSTEIKSLNTYLDNFIVHTIL